MGAVAREEPIIAVLGTDETAVVSVVDECITLLQDQPIRTIRIRGVPGLPLTLRRIVQELSGTEQGGLPVDDDELIVRVLSQRSDRQDRVLLIIEQAGSLPARTLAFLQVVSTVFGTTAPKLQLLFAGHPKFKYLLENDELASIRDRLGTTIQLAGAPSGARASITAPQRTHVGSLHRNSSTNADVSRRRKAFSSLLASITFLLGMTLTAFQQDPDDAFNGGEGAAIASGPTEAGVVARPPSQSPESQPPPAPAPPSQAAIPEPSRLSAPSQSTNNEPDPATPVQPAKRQNLPIGEQLARLRGEFEHFLAQTEWGSKRQSESERSRLFNEFLQWNYGASGAGPEPPPQIASASQLSQARVTLRFLASSTNGKAMARQFADELRTSVALARIRSAADVPKAFELRYFVREDEGLAAALAQLLQAPDVTWAIRIMPETRAMPAPHTIELWIPPR